MGTLTRVRQVIKANLPYAGVQARTLQYHLVKGPFALRRCKGNDSVVAVYVL